MPNHNCPRLMEFCVCCGEYTKVASRQPISTTVKNNFENYFGEEIQTAHYIPRIICSTCSTNIVPSKRAKRSKIEQFKWVKPDTDHSDCHICQTKLHKHFRRQVTYPPKLEDSSDDEFEKFLKLQQKDNYEPASSSPQRDFSEFDLPESSVYVSRKNDDAKKFTKVGLDNLMKDFEFSKIKSERLSSRFNDMCLLDPSCKVTQFRDRSDYIQPYFTQYDLKTVYLNDIEGLFRNIYQFPYNQKDWRLFIDSGKGSLKAILCHIGKSIINLKKIIFLLLIFFKIGNRFPKIPLFYSKGFGEDYFCIKIVMELIQYEKYKWVGDFFIQFYSKNKIK